MSKLRSVNTSFWTDPWVETLSPEEKLLFIYLFTNPLTNMLGIYECSIRKASFETGIELKQLERLLKGFEGLGKIKMIGNYIILINYMKHQRYNTNMKKSAIDIYNSLPNVLKIKGLSVSKETTNECFERLSKAYVMVPKVEVEVEVENELEREEEEGKIPLPLEKSQSDIFKDQSEAQEKEKNIPQKKETWNSAFEWLEINAPMALESFEMKFKRQIPDWKLFKERFNNKADEEEIRYSQRAIMGRLNNFALTWVSFAKKDKEKNKPKFNEWEDKPLNINR